jgi:hypothetical protein
MDKNEFLGKTAPEKLVTNLAFIFHFFFKRSKLPGLCGVSAAETERTLSDVSPS